MNRIKLSGKSILASVLFCILFFAGCAIFPVYNHVIAQSTTIGDPGQKKTTIGDPGKPNPIDENTDISDQFQLKNPVGSGSVDMRAVLDKILNAIIRLLSPVLVLMLVYSGYLFVVGRGNTEKITDAKRTLSYTLIGTVIVVAASAIAHVLENTIGAVIG